MNNDTMTNFTPGQVVKYVGTMTPHLVGLTGTVQTVDSVEVRVNFEGDRDADYVRGILSENLEIVAAPFVLKDVPVGTRLSYSTPNDVEAADHYVDRQIAGFAALGPIFKGVDERSTFKLHHGCESYDPNAEHGSYGGNKYWNVDLDAPGFSLYTEDNKVEITAYYPSVEDAVAFKENGGIRLGKIEKIDTSDSTVYIAPVDGRYSVWADFKSLSPIEVRGDFIQTRFEPSEADFDMAYLVEAEKVKATRAINRIEAQKDAAVRFAVETYKNRVRDYVLGIMDSHSWCNSGVTSHLQALDIQGVETEYTVEGSITYGFSTTVLAEDEDSARDMVENNISDYVDTTYESPDVSIDQVY